MQEGVPGYGFCAIFARMMTQMKFMLLVAGLCLLMWLTGSPVRQADDRVAAWYGAGVQWRDQNRLDSAIYCFHKAEEALTLATDPALKAKVYLNIADLLQFNKNYDLMLEYLHKALDAFEQDDDRRMVAYTMVDIGDCHRKMKDSSSMARFYYDKALAAAPDDTIVGEVVQQIGLNFYFRNEHDSARSYLQRSLGYPANEQQKSIRLLFLGVSFHDTGQLDSAEVYLLQALNSSPGLRQRCACYMELHDVAKERGDERAVAYYASLHAQYSDSIASMDAKLGSELHDIQLAKTEHLGRWVYGLVAGMVVLVGVGCGLILRRKWQAAQARARSKVLAEQLVRKKLEQEGLQRQLEQERQLRESHERLKAELMRKFEVEDARALERRRQACMDRLQEACAKAEHYPLLSARYKEIVSSAYDQVLHWSDTEQFIAGVNRDFNRFARRVEAGYMERSSASRTAVKLCVLMLFDAPEEHIRVLLGYDKKAYRQAVGRLCKRFDATDDDGLRMRLHQVLLEGTGG